MGVRVGVKEGNMLWWGGKGVLGEGEGTGQEEEVEKVDEWLYSLGFHYYLNTIDFLNDKTPFSDVMKTL